ncbi:unnamed protein product, partial [Laminaria digitata]
ASPTPSFSRFSPSVSREKLVGRSAASAAAPGGGVFAPALLAPHLDASPPAVGRVSRRRRRGRVSGGGSARRRQPPTSSSPALDPTTTDHTAIGRTGTGREHGAGRTTAGGRATGSATPGTAASRPEAVAPESAASWSIERRYRDDDGCPSRFSWGSYDGLSSGAVGPGSGGVGGGGGGYRYKKSDAPFPPRRASTGITRGPRHARGRRGARTVVIEDAPPSMASATGGDAAAGVVLGRGSQQEQQQQLSLSFCTVPLPAEDVENEAKDAGGEGSRQGNDPTKDTPTRQMLEVVPGSEHGGAGPDAPEFLTPKDGGGVFRAMGRSSSSSDTQSDGEWEELAMGLWRHSPDVARDAKENSSQFSPASTSSSPERRGRGFHAASRPRMTPPPHDNPSASVKPPPAAALPDATGDGGKGGGGGGKIPSARTRLLSPSFSTKPPACSSDPARPATSACPAAASGPAVGAIAAAVDGDAAAGEKVTGSAWGTCGTGAGRASVAADVAVKTVVVSAAGGLGGDQGGASPAAPIDAAEGCLTRPAELGLGLGAGPPAVPAEAGAEAEAPGREEFALRGEVSGTPRVAPSAVSVLAVAAVAAAAVEETSGREGIGRKLEDVLEEEFLKDDEPVPFPSRTPPGIKGKGFHSTARRGISGRDGDSSAGRGEGEGAVLSGAAQAALPEESVTGMEAKLCLPAKHVSGGAEEREVAVAAVA